MPTIFIEAAPEKVWRALTDKALRKKWFFGVDTETDWREGSPIVHRGEWNGKPYEDKGTIMTFDPPRRLVHTHWSPASGRPDKPENYETIRYELRQKGGGTELTVTEENVADEKQRAQSEQLWQRALEGLREVAERPHENR